MRNRLVPLVLVSGWLLSGTILPAIAQELSTDGWEFESQREEIAPRSWVDDEVLFDGAPTLALAGDEREWADGRWARTVPIDPETHYRFRVAFRASGVDDPARSILARLTWQDAGGKLIGQAEYPAVLREEGEDGWHRIEQTYRSPETARQARLELLYRWDADGSVHFGGASLEAVAAPEPRPVRLGTIHYRPLSSRTEQENLDQFAAYIRDAAALGADIICLPEGMTLAGTSKTYVEASEPLPGPTTRFLGALAKELGVYLVAGLLERDGPVVYNTAVLMDRQGNLAGKYRKVSLPREEYDGGVAPGDSFPTFDTDFGRIGIMICWDVSFPEAARALALDGAEVILMPIWGGITPLARARAIENQIFLVSSSYDMESGVFDKEGNLISQATEEEPVAVVEVDLAEKKDWPWLGDFRNRITREMPPRRAIRPPAP